MHWTILTCEYPPDCGGVGDYTAQVADALVAAGDDVTVFCPPRSSYAARAARHTGVDAAGVDVVVLDDVYGRLARRAIDARLDQRPSSSPTTILVQYVPTGFGLRGANIPWCRWLLKRSRRQGNDVRLVFHEPYFEFTWRPVRQNALALVERVMAKMLLRAASRVYLSTDAWRRYLTPYLPAAPSTNLITIPIPSAIPRCDRTAGVSARRAQLLGTSTDRLVGHFGTFGAQMRPMLEAVLTQILSGDPTVSAVCLGSGSDEFVRSVVAAVPSVRGRVVGTGRISRSDVALTLSACDLIVQPYPDGVTTRRTSVMASLVNARAVLTTTGHLTEPVWADAGAVALVPALDTDRFVAAARALLANSDDRTALAARGAKVYRERFALDHTIRALRGAVEGTAA
jgi:glycosyltransferase involved in cell wall biosynthesis